MCYIKGRASTCILPSSPMTPVCLGLHNIPNYTQNRPEKVHKCFRSYHIIRSYYAQPSVSRDASQWRCSVMGCLLLLYTMHHDPYTIRTTDAPKVTERNCVWHTRRPLHQCTTLLHHRAPLHQAPGTLAEIKQVTAQCTSSPDI